MKTHKKAPTRYKYLFETIKERKPRTIMEIGVYDGKHAKQMIECAQQYNDDIAYYGFDLFQMMDRETILKELSKPKIFEESSVYAELCKTGAKINLFKGFTRDTLPRAYELISVYMDFVFIDGGHSLNTIDWDWFWVQKFLHKDSITLFDDYYKGNYSVGCAYLIDTKIGPTYKATLLESEDKNHLGDTIFMAKIVSA